MHISLDSALGRQRRLNSVGESVLQIAPDAAAAYSLRSLTGGDPNVVRVRRESDNTEKDFSGSQIESGEMARWVNEQPTLPLDLRELDEETGERDGALIQAAAAYSLRNLKASGTDVQPTGDSPRPVENNTDLFLPDEFPVTLQRNNEEYFIKETGADWFANYSGATLYVSPSGSDTTGDGSSSNPYQSLNTVISNASDNDIISMSAGIYAMPTLAVSKDLAFVCPSGKAYIGTFNDLSSAQIDAIDYSGTVLHNVDDVVTGETFKGWIRTDGTLVGGVRGSAVSGTNGQAIDYQDFGVMSVYAGSTSANFSTGTSETLQDLVDAGSVLAWSDADTGRFRVATGTSVYIGENITLASYGTDVVAGIGSANLILDGCEIYGGSGNCVSHPGSGSVLMFNTLVAGSSQDNIDYRGTVVAVESNITSNWCDTGASDNASTGHDSCKVLRVGGTYRGGSRTVHDVNNTKAYVYSCTIGDAVSNDKTLLLSGFSTLGSETCTLGYGDITFIDTFNDGGLTNLYIDSESTATNSELNQGWSYFATGKYVVQVRRSSDDAVQSFTATEVADGTLESWVGVGNDGHVKTWYDQSGNTNDAVQTDATKQPKIVDGGTYLEEIDFDGTDDVLNFSEIDFSTNSWMLSAVVNWDGAMSPIVGGSVSQWALQVAAANNFSARATSDSTIHNFVPTATITTGDGLFTVERSSDVLSGYYDGDFKDAAPAITASSEFKADKIGLRGSFYGSSAVKEIIIYDSDQSDNRKAIEANIGETYGIVGIPAYDNEVNGYVQTWYDKSGEGNDAEQSTAANQPKIVGEVTPGQPHASLGAVDFDGSSDHLSNTVVDLSNGDFSVFTCYTPPTDDFDGILLGTSDGKWLVRIVYNAITLRDTNSVIHSIPLDENLTANKRYIISVIRSGTSITAYIDGTAQTNVKTVSASNEFRFDRVGVRGASGNRLEGGVSELIVYPEDQTQNREAIEANISNAFPKNLDVFLLLGQSNMVGFPSDNYPPTVSLSGSNDSKVWIASSSGTSSNDAGDLVDNSVAYDTEGLIKLDTYAAQSRFGYGPNLDFARTLVNDHNYDNLGIIKWARNGTALDVYWKKEANKFYPTLVSYCNEQINGLKAKFEDHNVRVAGIFWFQGHGDSTIQSRAEAYETNLTNLISDLRSDVIGAESATLIIGRSPDFWKLPYEAGEPAADAQKVTNVDTIKNAQVSVATNDENAVWISTDDATALEPWVSGVAGNNPVHLITDDKQTLGVRAANAFVTKTNYTG